jgi:hypothetical protein
MFSRALRHPWLRRVALLAAVVLVAAGCTTETRLRPGRVDGDFTERWVDADIARLPQGTLHRLSRYELHDEVDPLLHVEPGIPHTDFVVRYATEMDRDEVVDHYLDTFGGDWAFVRTDAWADELKAYRGGLQAEITVVSLVHSPDELPGLRALATEVTVFVGDDNRLRDLDPFEHPLPDRRGRFTSPFAAP